MTPQRESATEPPAPGGPEAARSGAGARSILRFAAASCALLAPYDLDLETAAVVIRYVTACIEQNLVALGHAPALVPRRAADARARRNTEPGPALGRGGAAPVGPGFASLF